MTQRAGIFWDQNGSHREAWVTAPSPVMMFFVDENDGGRTCLSVAQENDGDALDQLGEGWRHLSGIPADRRSTFAEAAERLGLPGIDRWCGGAESPRALQRCCPASSSLTPSSRVA